MTTYHVVECIDFDRPVEEARKTILFSTTSQRMAIDAIAHIHVSPQWVWKRQDHGDYVMWVPADRIVLGVENDGHVEYTFTDQITAPDDWTDPEEPFYRVIKNIDGVDTIMFYGDAKETGTFYYHNDTGKVQKVYYKQRQDDDPVLTVIAETDSRLGAYIFAVKAMRGLDTDCVRCVDWTQIACMDSSIR